MPKKLLITRDNYMMSGIHIGTKQVTSQMKKFIYHIRKDGLVIFDLNKVDERIRIAAKFLAEKKNILVVARKNVAHKAVKKFGEIVNAKVVVGRYLPGMLTNPFLDEFFEADVLLVTDPLSDRQAIEDALRARIPIVAICDTSNETKNVDLIIPGNNKGRRAIATLYWLLAREILKERKEIKQDKDFAYKPEDFI